MEMTRNERIERFLDSIYIPKAKLGEFAKLLRIAKENDYREIEESDSGKSFEFALYIKTNGRGARSSFDTFHILRVDVGNVSAEYADIALFLPEGIIPKRMSRRNIKLSLLNN
mgnify:CR=1 FL=1